MSSRNNDSVIKLLLFTSLGLLFLSHILKKKEAEQAMPFQNTPFIRN